MIKSFIPLIGLIFTLYACNDNANKVSESNTGHNHDHSDHDHNHNDDNHDHAHDHDHDHDHGEDHSDEIIFTTEQAKAAGLQTQIISPGTFHEVVKTSGQIQSSQGDEVTIVATGNGTLTFSNAAIAEGKSIAAGESIITISAKNLQEGDPIAKIKIEYETAERELKRAESLIADKIISDKDFQLARQRYENARTVYNAQAANVTSSGLRVTSPIAGFLKNRLVNQGEYVTIGQPIAVVSQNRKLQLKAEVSERYFNNLKGLSTAHFKTAYDTITYKLNSLNGKLLSYGKTTNSSSFYIPVIFEFDNKGDVIPGAYTEVYLLSTPLQNVIAIPLTAITEEQGLHFVYLRIGKEAYKKQEVQLGQSDGDRVHVKSGLESGNEIVTKGAYQVKIAANASIIPEGHTH